MQITKENIIETLQYNGFTINELPTVIEFKDNSYVITINNIANMYSFCCKITQATVSTHDFDEFLAFVQKRIELKTLPEFDFVDYMCDNGFEWIDYLSRITSNNISMYLCQIDETVTIISGRCLPITKTTADLLISINKQLEQANVNKTASC